VIKAMRFKPVSRGYGNRGGECILSITLILPAALGPGVYSASNSNDCQKQKNNASGE
jgi:hypothetical protein